MEQVRGHTKWPEEENSFCLLKVTELQKLEGWRQLEWYLLEQGTSLAHENLLFYFFYEN